MAPPSVIEATTQGLSFAEVLHDCFASGVILIDGQMKITALNSRAKHLLGMNPEQSSLPVFAALPEPLQALVRATGSTQGASPADRQIALQAGTRGPVTLQVSAVPMPASRRNSGVVLVLNDLTPVRQIEEHIRQLDRLASIGTLAAGMAHEIKNALVAGKTFVDLLLEKHQDAELVEVVRREMGRIDAIVSRMRNFASPVLPTHREVRLHEIIEDSLRIVQPQLEAKLISVKRSFRASRDRLLGNDYQLQQALVNLFLNALDAMGSSGTLLVTTDLLAPGDAPAGLADAADQAKLRLTIADNGIGITPENLARLFEPFFTTKPNGTGLGLLLTRRIIQEHRGSITAQSEPDKGTSFQILVPVSP